MLKYEFSELSEHEVSYGRITITRLLTVKVSCYKRRTATISEGEQIDGKMSNCKGRKETYYEGMCAII